MACKINVLTIHIPDIPEKKRAHYMASSTSEENWALYQSAINMLDFYRTELRSLIKGKMIVDSIPQGTRRLLMEYGVLRKFGSRFELTDRGRKLLR